MKDFVWIILNDTLIIRFTIKKTRSWETKVKNMMLC